MHLVIRNIIILFSGRKALTFECKIIILKLISGVHDKKVKVLFYHGLLLVYINLLCWFLISCFPQRVKLKS